MTLEEWVKSQVPRLLTQLNRDPDSPTFGCFDRNYWHYKIRDFSSSVLQQSVYALTALPEISNISKTVAQEWLVGSLQFWARLPERGGGLNEYYPYEQSYPGTAFSLQAVTRMLMANSALMSEEVAAKIGRTSSFLAKRFERQALNQQAAGLAALAQAKELGLVGDGGRVEKIANRFFGEQVSEGWFPEYGGPDLGYLSVTIDMLMDYYDVSGDERARNAMEKAVEYMSWFVGERGELLTVANSRETDYIVPYGMVRLAQRNDAAAKMVKLMFAEVGKTWHFLQSMDERYSLHYIYNSCVRALPYMSAIRRRGRLPQGECFFWQSGVYVNRTTKQALVIAGKKGGSYQTSLGGVVDYGVRVRKAGKVWATQVQNEKMEVAYTGNALTVKGSMIRGNWLLSTPVKHVMLRAASWVLGEAIIGWIKRQMIFLKATGEVSWRRDINLKKRTVRSQVIAEGEFEVVAGSKYSIRHVASAFSYSPWELANESWSKKVKDRWTRRSKLG